MADGTAFVSLNDMSALGAEERVDHPEVEHIAVSLLEEGLIERVGGTSFKVGPEIALFYELTFDRRAHVQANALRRELLTDGVTAYLEPSEALVLTREDPGRFETYPWGEIIAATEVLELLGLLMPRRGMGSVRLLATATGYDVFRDEARLAAELPVTISEDEEAHARVAPDALAFLIRDCEQMLTERGWTGALRELRRGDDEYDKRDWVDAVSEYYAALESGFKHRLDEIGHKYAEGAALKDLARLAADVGVIPANYQALFSFIDSIRSPRRHGTGAKPDKVEIGPAEALLMGNHVRALLLYLGHRPQ
jgi:hypothetical protein